MTMIDRVSGHLRLARCGVLLATILVSAGCSAGADTLVRPTASTALPSPLPSGSWASFGNGPEHDFSGPTALTASTVSSLREAWFFPTGDAVTATPTVVGDVAYFGSWDTKFYAVDVATGVLRWSFQLDSQTAVTPYPGEQPRVQDSDGGLVTSTAWYEPGNGSRPNLVIFGGGYTLYAIDADTGQLYWKHVYDGLPEQPASPTTDPTRIFSSPIVEHGNIYFGTSTDGQPGERGYVVAASLLTGAPVWIHQTDVNSRGTVLDDGCGGIWSSGSYLPVLDDVVFTMADCNDGNLQTATSERVVALDARTGSVRWTTSVGGPNLHCDFDEVGTNVGLTPAGTPEFLGAFGKDGRYISLDPATGAIRWSTRVTFGGTAGGFIGSPAFDGSVIYGATGLGDLTTPSGCSPGSPGDATSQVNPSFFAIDATSGRILWHASDARSFGATTVSGGMTFSCQLFDPTVQVRDAITGFLLTKLALPGPCWSGVAISGGTVLTGVGTSASGTPTGVIAFRSP
jgi:polyvinyl alcohol dehydrogenase (cytochrome)